MKVNIFEKYSKELLNKYRKEYLELNKDWFTTKENTHFGMREVVNVYIFQSILKGQWMDDWGVIALIHTDAHFEEFVIAMEENQSA